MFRVYCDNLIEVGVNILLLSGAQKELTNALNSTFHKLLKHKCVPGLIKLWPHWMEPI